MVATYRPLGLGIDVGSTTAKMAVVDESGAVLYSDYRRHNADVVGTLKDMVRSAGDVLGNLKISISVTGSAGIGVSERYGLPFVQEVVATADTGSFIDQMVTLLDLSMDEMDEKASKHEGVHTIEFFTHFHHHIPIENRQYHT